MATPEMKAIPVSTANPFPGLRPFREDEAGLFFGQEDHVDDLIDRVGRKRFVALLGQSGCGKSSLMRAGLLPQLRRGQVDDGQARWVIVQTQPGENPLGLLAGQLALAFPGVAVAAELQRDSRALARITTKAGLHERQKVLIIVDQFEELFRFRRQTASSERHDQADYYVQLLLEAVRDIESPVYVMLAMRTEFLGDCALFFDLAEQVNEGTYLLPRMSRDQTKEVITGPVQQRGATIAVGLVHQLLNDAEGQEDGLPLLQHALRRIWDAWVDRQQPQAEIGMADYELKLSEADHKAWPSLLSAHLNLHLNKIYEGLGQPREDVARGLFRLLSERDSRGRDTRRPLAYEDLVAAFAPEQRPDIEPVIEAFRNADLGRTFLVPGQGKALAGSMVDISHECLLRRWDRLRKWLGWEAESRRMFELLADAADGAGWRGPAHSDALPPLEGYQLRILHEWRERSKPTAGLLNRYRGVQDLELGRCRREFVPAMEYLDWSAARKAQADEERLHEHATAERQEVELRRLAAENRATMAEVALVRRRQRAIWLWSFGLAAALCLLAVAVREGKLRKDAEFLREEAVAASKQAVAASKQAKRDRDNAVAAEEAAEVATGRALEAQGLAEFRAYETKQAEIRLQNVNKELNADKAQLFLQTAELDKKRSEAQKMADQLRVTNQQLAVTVSELDSTNVRLAKTNEDLRESLRNEDFQKAGNKTQLGLQKAAAELDHEKRVKLTQPLLADYRDRAQARKEMTAETGDVLRSGLDAISQALQGGQLASTKNVGAGVTAAAYSGDQGFISLLPVAGLSLQTHGAGAAGAVQPLKAYHLGHLLFEPGRRVSTFDISPGGQFIALGTEGGRVTVFERTTAGPAPYRRILSKRPRWNAAALVRFSRDGRLVVTSTGQGGWTLFDLHTKRETAQDEKNGHHLAQAAISTNGHWLAYTTNKQGVVVQPLAERTAPRILVPEAGQASLVKRPIDISDDGWVITTSAQDALELHTNVDQHTRVFRGDAAQPVSAVQLSPREEWLAVAGRSGAISLFRWEDVKAAVLQGSGRLPEPRVTLRPGLGRESRVLRLTWQDQTLAALDEAGTLNIWKPFAAPERLQLLTDVQRMLQQPQFDLNNLGVILRKIAEIFQMDKASVAQR